MTIKEIKKDPTILKDMDMNSILTFLKENITKENMEDISEIMKLPELQGYVQFLVYKKINNQQISDSEFQNLYLLIYILQSIYNYSGEDTGVSDYDYDRLYELMTNYGVDLVSTPLVGGKVAHHKYPSLRGTLKKIYTLTEEEEAENESRDSLVQWVESRERDYLIKTGRKIDLWNEEIYVFPKWDGVSVQFEFNEKNELGKALTRGNTETNEAQDITFIFTPIVHRIRDAKMTGRAYGLKTEVMMHDTDLETYNKKFHKDYKSTRSIISSIVNSDTLDGRENLLEVVRLRTAVLNEDGTEALQELASNVFERPFLRCRLKDTEAIRKFAYNHRNVGGLNCDGAVLYIIDPDIRKVLGRKDHKNQYEVAFKFNEEVGYSKITGITFNVSSFGRVFPVANFKPLHMKGNTVSNVSLGSMARFYKLGLRVGDTVKILYEIIPYLVFDPDDPKCKRSRNPVLQPPKVCPDCHETLEQDSGGILTCINPDCDCRKKGKILNYVQKMEIANLGEGKIDALYKSGYLTRIEDLYRLKDHYDELIKLPGFDRTSISKIIDNVDKKRRVPAHVFMGSVGISSIGKKTFDKIFNVYSIEDLIEFAEDKRVSKLIAIDGIGELNAKKILDGIDENQKLIRHLLGKDIMVYYAKKNDAKFIAVFHKIRSVSVKDMIEKRGGVVEDGLTKRTNFLIVPEGFGESSSATSDKARKYGIPIVEIQNVAEYIEENY